MRVLVTGAFGFIGREVVEELLEQGFEVYALKSLRSTGENFVAKENLKIVAADITKRESIAGLEQIEQVDAVIHSAGLAHQFGDTEKSAFDSVNVAGTENTVDLAVKLKASHFILIGSTAIYGIISGSSNGTKITEDFEPQPETLYAASKLEAEKVCRQRCEAYNLALTIFRLAPVIGESNVGNVSRLIEAIDKRRFVWVGEGGNLKSLIYKRDVARACVSVLKRKKGGTEIFNLAAEPVKMKDFVNEISRRLGKKTPPVAIPPTLLRFIFGINSKTLNIKKIRRIAGTIEKWLSDDVYSGEKLFRQYEFKPQTSIVEGLIKQIDSYKSEKRKKIENGAAR